MNSIVSSKRKRNSSIELLRIIAMLFIVMSHSSAHGNFPKVASDILMNNYFLDWLVLGNLGVDIFVIISGYFLSMKEFKIQSITKLLAQVWFYSYLCLGIYILAGNTVSFKELITAVLPTIFGQYWFFTAYIVLLILTPYINVFIKNTTQKQLLSCLVIMMTLWSILPTFTLRSMYGSELPQFLMFYLMGAYLRKYPNNILSIPKIRRWLTGCSGVLLFASSMVLRYFNNNIWSLSITSILFYSRTSILVIGLAMGIFATAVYHKPWSNKFVNTMGSCVFGVYLLHDNSLIRKILWPVWINNDAFYDSQILILRILLSVMIVYIGCALIEILRQKLFAKPIECLIEKAYSVSSRVFKKTLQRIYQSE